MFAALVDARVRVHWWRMKTLCFIGGHDPAEFRMQRGTLADIEAGNVAATLEYRCRRCWTELNRS